MVTRCPHCFVALPSERYAFRCTGSCREDVDHRLSAARGTEERGKPVVEVESRPGQEVAGATCGSCRTPTRQEVCPGCHYPLLPGWRRCTTTCLATAGARASGKSIYLGVLKKQAELWCERHGHALVAPDPRTDEQYARLYEAPLYERRGFLPPTPTAAMRDAPHREPLIYDMGPFGRRHHMLVLRDVAGEDLENPPDLVGPFSFFARADVVVFLFDPLRLEEVRGQLEGAVPPQVQPGGDPVVVLRNLVRLIRGGVPFGEPVRTPLALVIAKFDTLAELATVEGGPLTDVMANAGATFNLDPSLAADFDRSDADRLQAELQSLLSRLHAGSLLRLVEQSFAEHRLFAVSALGALPADADSLSPRGIAPFRVVDPLKWALSRTGMIAAK